MILAFYLSPHGPQRSAYFGSKTGVYAMSQMLIQSMILKGRRKKKVLFLVTRPIRGEGVRAPLRIKPFFEALKSEKKMWPLSSRRVRS